MPHADPYLLPMAALLTAIGLTEIYRLEPDDAFRQGLWIVIGVALFAATLARAPPRLPAARVLQVPLRPRRDRAARRSRPLPGIGVTVNGAQLWVQVGPLQFQPGELAKIVLIVFLAGYLREKREVLAQGRLKDFGPLLLIWGGAMLVLVLTNDLGSALLYFGIFLAMLYVATGRLLVRRGGARALRRAAPSAPTAPSRASETGSSIWLDPWQRRRTDAGYQIVQSTYSIADGGFGGTGPRPGDVHDDRTARQLIPYLNTDFIYSALAQELGLVGASALLLVYMLFVVRGFRTALLAERRLLEAARRRAHVRVRAPDVHHRRRHPAADPADRDHAAVRQLRRLERARELRPAGRAAARLQPRERARTRR